MLLSNAGQGPGETEVYKQNLRCRRLPDRDSGSIVTFPAPGVRHRHCVFPCEAQANRTWNAAGCRPPKEKARLPQEGSWTALWHMSFLWQTSFLIIKMLAGGTAPEAPSMFTLLNHLSPTVGN